MAQDHALAFAAAPEHHQGLALGDVEVDALQDGLAVEALGEPAHADIRTRAVFHPIAMNNLVRKKSDTSTPIDAATTADVVARPTPSAPPVAPSPLLHAMIEMR